MFSVECAGHGGRVLLGPESIVALLSAPGGFELHWRCTCGRTGVLRTGSPVAA